MAEINNFSEITENFDTIKTLLNSIRAQGILNTSDIDKLLAGINSKLEKINTEEDIDLIKIFLSELKQNLDERHNVLISKFGAIESLFSNLLKNSADTLKSSEVKEQFDIVATNLSVFSREVVSQKETLTDITLRLDTMRSDDSQKKEIIKSISLLKNDLENLKNGFDSIVLSLNENFKTLIKTLSNVDQSEAINKFGGQLDDIVNSSNTILSALQMMDKKNDQLEDALKGLASQDDVIGAKKWLSDLVTKNHELNDSINNLSDKYYKIDNLAEKIDASVSIIAGLKTVISESESQNSEKIMNELEALQASLKEVTTNQSFEDFKNSLEIVLKDISSGSINLQNALVDASSEIRKISTNLQALDISVNFQSLMSNLENIEHDIKEHTDVVTDKISQLVEVNATRTLNEISNNADSLISKLKDSHYTMTKLCEKSFNDVAEDIANLKTIVSQIDENNVSANNAIFSNITDRLAIFENSLKGSLEKQEDYVANSSSQLLEQIQNIKDLSGVIDYKLDASVIEVNNSKREFAELKSAVQDVLGLDFVNVVKDLKVDLYAVKQDLTTAFENSSSEQAEKSANDLFGKYELLVSKLDNVEDTLKQAQSSALTALKPILDNISSSIMDVISYVSSQKELNTDSIDVKLANIVETVKDSSLSYVENVRDIVEVIRTQVENNLIQIQKENSNKIDSINSSISKNTESLKEEIKYSYNKLLEVQDNFDEIKEALNVNNITLSTNIGDIISSTDGLKTDFEVKLATLKNSLLDKISDFKQEFTCENADKISEIKFTTENLHAKSLQNSQELIGQFKGEIAQIIGTLKLNVEELAEQLSGTTLKVEDGNREVVNFIKNDFCAEVDNSVNTLKSDLSEFSSDMQNYTDKITCGLDNLKNSVDSMSEKTTSSLTSTLAKILDNFVSLKGVLSSFNETNMQGFKDSVNSITEDFASLKDRLESVDRNIDEDLARQFSLIETNFEDLSNSLTDLFSRSDNELSLKIENGLVDISARIDETVASNLEQYKAKIEALFDDLIRKNNEQSEYIKECVLGLNETLEATLTVQNENAENRLKDIADEMKLILDGNIEVTSADYESLKAKLADFTVEMSSLNKTLSANLKQQLDEIAKLVNSNLEVQGQETAEKFEEIQNTVTSQTQKLNSQVENVLATVKNDNSSLQESIRLKLQEIGNAFTTELTDFAEKSENNFAQTSDSLKNLIETQAEHSEIKLDSIAQDLSEKNTEMLENLKSQLDEIAKFVDSGLEIQAKHVEAKFEEISNKAQQLAEKLNTVDNNNASDSEALSTKLDDIKSTISLELNQNLEIVENDVDDLSQKLDSFKNKISEDLKQNSDLLSNNIYEKIVSVINKLETINSDINSGMELNSENIIGKIEKISDEVSLLQNSINEDFQERSGAFTSSVENLTLELGNLKSNLNSVLEQHSNAFAGNISNLSHNLDKLQNDISHNIEQNSDAIANQVDKLAQDFSRLKADISAGLQQNSVFVAKNLEAVLSNITANKLEELKLISETTQNKTSDLKVELANSLAEEVEGLYDKVQALFEATSVNFTTHLDNENSRILEDLTTKTMEFKASFEALNDRLDKDEISQMNVFQAQVKELSGTFNTLIEEAKNVTKSEVSAISETLINNSKNLFDEVEQAIEDKITTLLATTADISAGELQSMEAFANQILKQVEVNKQNVVSCKDLIVELVQKECELVSEDIEKETDVIVKDIIEQFNLFKGIQKDELDKLTVHVENSIEDYIFNYINELKSYMDVRTDSTIMNQKIDNIQTKLSDGIEGMLSTMNKFLEASVFSSAMSDLRTANEILVNSTADKLNKQINDFVQENVTNKFEDKLNLFDKKFIDTVVDKYEEIKMISSQYNQSFENIQTSVDGILSEFKSTKDEINATMQTIMDGISNSINSLNVSFADLKAQILNKSFDEAFQASLNNQITGIENLVKEQFGYLEDISDLCCNNLPELTEMNTLVKYGIQQSITDLTNKVDAQDISLNEELAKLKSDIITQFLNIFNQISFVAEQEEILDFIQEKHSELITILSHIVTTIDNVDAVKDNVAVIDNKVDSLKEDIDLINEKITSIISSDGDIDYVYSLQDLESDIANLRLVLNEMKSSNNSKELEELVTSTNDIYKLVESLKTEMPKFEYDEFKKDFETLSEDIVSISTRTNKLILASDESHKCLQDNLQEFKLVINDLDERTRNFAHESGIDRLDNKLGAINTMIQNGAKTNQVFNQVFEYLAEWVDKAGEQITTISDKVETLDDIGQIKVMLEDLKAEAEDNTESTELIEALSNVFEKQAKRISSLEAKLDRVIVETTINNKNSKIDMTPFENTLNRFLVAIDDKMSSQQDKINSLESKLEEVMTKIDPKDTAQLTKKVGGMDRQIAKLNKSIEKIASHVVEK